MKQKATIAMEMASANVESVNVPRVMLESFVLVNVMNVQYRKKMVKFVVATETVTYVLPTMFLDVPAILVGLDLIVQLWEVFVLKDTLREMVIFPLKIINRLSVESQLLLESFGCMKSPIQEIGLGRFWE